MPAPPAGRSLSDKEEEAAEEGRPHCLGPNAGEPPLREAEEAFVPPPSKEPKSRGGLPASPPGLGLGLGFSCLPPLPSGGRVVVEAVWFGRVSTLPTLMPTVLVRRTLAGSAGSTCRLAPDMRSGSEGTGREREIAFTISAASVSRRSILFTCSKL